MNLSKDELDKLRQTIAQSIINKYGWWPNKEIWVDDKYISELTELDYVSVKKRLTEYTTANYSRLWLDALKSYDLQEVAYMSLGNYLYRLVCKGNIDTDDALDIVQNALIIVHENLFMVRHPEAFIGWAQTITSRAIISFREKHENVQPLNSMLLADAYQPNEISEQNEDENERQEKKLRDLIRRNLRSEQQKLVIIESFLNNKTTSQIAKLLGTSEGNIRILRHRALEKLRMSNEIKEWMDKQKLKDSPNSLDMDSSTNVEKSTKTSDVTDSSNFTN